MTHSCSYTNSWCYKLNYLLTSARKFNYFSIDFTISFT